ncbi:MAG: helix-turn-helix domain-containing protein [Devosia sp.]
MDYPPDQSPARRAASRASAQRRRIESDARAVVVFDLVAAATGVPVARLMQLGRGTVTVSEARNLAMYMLHVALGLSYAEVATLLGLNRSTIAYACARIEDERDNNGFNEMLDTLEAIICKQVAKDRMASLAQA